MNNNFYDVDYEEVNQDKQQIKGDNALYYSTSQVSRILNIPDSKVRYYSGVFESILNVETSNKQRKYTHENIKQLQFIIKLKNEGLTIKQILDYCQNISLNEENIQIKQHNPMQIQTLVTALLEEQTRYFESLKNDIRTIVENTVETKLNTMLQSNTNLMESTSERINLMVDSIVSEKISEVGNLITEQNEVAVSKIGDIITSKVETKIDQLEANVTKRDVDLISKLQSKLDEHKQNYEESTKEEKKGLFSRLFSK